MSDNWFERWKQVRKLGPDDEYDFDPDYKWEDDGFRFDESDEESIINAIKEVQSINDGAPLGGAALFGTWFAKKHWKKTPKQLSKKKYNELLALPENAGKSGREVFKPISSFLHGEGKYGEKKIGIGDPYNVMPDDIDARVNPDRWEYTSEIMRRRQRHLPMTNKTVPGGEYEKFGRVPDDNLFSLRPYRDKFNRGTIARNPKVREHPLRIERAKQYGVGNPFSQKEVLARRAADQVTARANWSDEQKANSVRWARENEMSYDKPWKFHSKAERSLYYKGIKPKPSRKEGILFDLMSKPDDVEGIGPEIFDRQKVKIDRKRAKRALDKAIKSGSDSKEFIKGGRIFSKSLKILPFIGPIAALMQGDEAEAAHLMVEDAIGLGGILDTEKLGEGSDNPQGLSPRYGLSDEEQAEVHRYFKRKHPANKPLGALGDPLLTLNMKIDPSGVGKQGDDTVALVSEKQAMRGPAHALTAREMQELELGIMKKLIKRAEAKRDKDREEFLKVRSDFHEARNDINDMKTAYRDNDPDEAEAEYMLNSDGGDRLPRVGDPYKGIVPSLEDIIGQAPDPDAIPMQRPDDDEEEYEFGGLKSILSGGGLM